MTAKRTPLQRSRQPTITEEMLALFVEGLALIADGSSERWKTDTPPGKKERFIQIEKLLCWRLLRLPVSAPLGVFDETLDRAHPPYYLQGLNLEDWFVCRAARKALQEELAYRRRTERRIARQAEA
jgi:hypothetical protein